MTVRDIRKKLGKTQREMAQLLGTSLRAIQSYETGWRSIPASVDKLALLLLYLHWRSQNGDVVSCWDVMGCDPDRRSSCYAYQLGAGDLCWFVTAGDWTLKARCMRCPMMSRWLNGPTEPEV
jgi:hypothetical protein